MVTAVRVGFRVDRSEAEILTQLQRHSAEVRIPPSPPLFFDLFSVFQVGVTRSHNRSPISAALAPQIRKRVFSIDHSTRSEDS